MRAIIIEDKDARALIDSLELTKLKDSNVYNPFNPERPVTAEDMHAAFRYVVVKWLQDQGCNVIR